MNMPINQEIKNKFMNLMDFCKGFYELRSKHELDLTKSDFCKFDSQLPDEKPYISFYYPHRLDALASSDSQDFFDGDGRRVLLSVIRPEKKRCTGGIGAVEEVGRRKKI